MKRKDFLRRFYPVILVLLVFIVWKYREGKNPTLQLVDISGTTMGTISYSIKYFSEGGINYKEEIDSLLKVWNLSLSTYIPSSEISRFNTGDSCFHFESEYFLPVLKTSREVFEASEGAFDPTVGPLVNAWGFGPDKSMVPDSSRVESLLMMVGFDKISFDEEKLCKAIPGINLDFSAIAKGYAVDVVADFIASKGINDLMVEIGGEIVCQGVKPGDVLWRTAIEYPVVQVYDRKIHAVAELSNKAIATSGNYRNYYVHEGKKYAHIIDPATGYPVFHSLLSASVFADNCMTADAYATAFMVMGFEKARAVLEKNESLDAFLIYRKDDGTIDNYVTAGIQDRIETYDTAD